MKNQDLSWKSDWSIEVRTHIVSFKAFPIPIVHFLDTVYPPYLYVYRCVKDFLISGPLSILHRTHEGIP